MPQTDWLTPRTSWLDFSDTRTAATRTKRLREVNSLNPLLPDGELDLDFGAEGYLDLPQPRYPNFSFGNGVGEVTQVLVTVRPEMLMCQPPNFTTPSDRRVFVWSRSLEIRCSMTVRNDASPVRSCFAPDRAVAIAGDQHHPACCQGRYPGSAQ